MWGSFDEKVLKTYLEEYAERQAMAIGYPMPEFADKKSMPCNKPRAEVHNGKSHVVKACENGKERLIRFGQAGVKGSPKKEGESESYRKRREAFKARHAKNISKGKMSAAYWADKVKW